MHAFASETSRPRPRALTVLDSVQIAQPCPADWEAMHAVDGFAYRRVRHCAECNLRVYNLSAMPRAEADELLRKSEGRLCVRLYRRQDGTVLTADCSYFRRAVDTTAAGARRVGWVIACGFAALIGSGVWAAGMMRDGRVGGASQSNFVQSGMDQLCNVRPIAWVIERLRPMPPIPGNGVPGQMAPMGEMAPLMGDVAMPAVPMGTPVEIGQVAVPQSGWIAGGPRGFEMGDTIQGAAGPMPSPPAQDPRQWLQIDEPRPPL